MAQLNLVVGDVDGNTSRIVAATVAARDQYRAEDILRALYFTIQAHGTMPDELIFEQGRWMGNAIRGIEVSNGHGLVRWGGIDALMRINYTHSPLGKASSSILSSDLSTQINKGQPC